jgi:hypothetical protein
MADSTDAGASAHVGALQGALRETLERSLADRLAGRPGAEQNIANAFWGDHAPPRDLGEALTWLGPTCTNIAVRLFERIRAVDPTLALWRQIRYLRNGWYGGSAGFKVVYEDPAAMSAHLDARFTAEGGGRIARDTFLGGIEHQLTSARAVAAGNLRSLLGPDGLPDADTWREVDGPRKEALHFCLGKHEPRPTELDDIHIDWSSPVIGIDTTTRRCRYSLLFSVTHWAQAKLGWGSPVFAFDRIDARISRMAARDGAPSGWAPFVTRWRAAEWGLVMRGKSGAEEALQWLRECDGLANTS